jgi:hypothetical protein
MLQWVQTKHDIRIKTNEHSSGTVHHEYTYNQEWRSDHINSNMFHHSHDHQNQNWDDRMINETTVPKNKIVLKPFRID